MTESNKKLNSDDRQKALKEAFVKEIRKELASDHSDKPSFEEFKKAVEKDRASRRKRRTAIAACFAVALLVSFFAFDMLASDVGADKNPKETIVTEDGVIIEDGGYGSSGNEMIVATNMEDVNFISLSMPQLMIPNYYPEGFAFKKLTVETFDTGDIAYEYIFNNSEGDTLEIEVYDANGSETSLYVGGDSQEISCSKGTIYIQKKENKIATIRLDDGISMYVWAKLPDGEIISIIENMMD